MTGGAEPDLPPWASTQAEAAHLRDECGPACRYCEAAPRPGGDVARPARLALPGMDEHGEETA